MKYSIEIIELLKTELQKPLPGQNAHLRLSPRRFISPEFYNPDPSAVLSAVLLLLYPRGDVLHLVFILRSEYDGIHSGQISFPGGRAEKSDSSLRDTALRETQEETGAVSTHFEILGELSPFYIFRSNYMVYPFVAFSPNAPQFHPDANEVQEIVEIPIKHFLSEESVVVRELKFRDHATVEAPGFLYQDKFIWGATAMIMSEFLEVLSACRIS